MKHRFVSRILIACALAAALFAVRSHAQDAPTPATAPESVPETPAPAVAPVKAAPSPGIAEILKMLDAGVSKDVVRTYVETTPGGAPTPADLIALKDKGVSDEITMALLKRGSTPAPAAVSGAPVAGNAPTKAIIINNSGYGRLNPESYDYFQYYYLYPRTLANVNQTLGYNAAYYGYNLGQTWVPGYGPRAYGRGYAFGGYPYR